MRTTADVNVLSQSIRRRTVLVLYWTVVDDGERVARVADECLQQLRLGQDPAENTTDASTEARADYVRW